MSKKTYISFNGKFLSAHPTGVHRVAAELINAYLSLHRLQGWDDRDCRIIAPRNASNLYSVDCAAVKKCGFLRGQLWEQLELPAYSRKDILVNLCNLAPLTHPRSITMVHDAQVFTTPQSYAHTFGVYYRSLLPAIGRTSRLILTVSNFSKMQLVRSNIASAEKIYVIPNGVDHFLPVKASDEIVERFNLSHGRYVLALANLQAHKNIPFLLNVFASPALSNAKLVLFGAEDRRTFEAKGFSVPPNVLFVGQISDSQLKGLFEKALCFAFPSLTEGFGLPPLEAMSLGCPAVVAPCGALPEVCGPNAIYANPDDRDKWVSHILALMADQTYHSNAKKTGIEWAQRFTWKAAALSLQTAISAIDG